MRKMKIVLPLLILVLCIIFLIFAIPQLKSDKAGVFFVKERSWFSDFQVQGQAVEFLCEITLKNTSEAPAQIKIRGSFPEDVGRLLEEDFLIAKGDDGEDAVFFVPAKSEKTFTVFFVGTFAGVNEKHDRTLPELEIIRVP